LEREERVREEDFAVSLASRLSKSSKGILMTDSIVPFKLFPTYFPKAYIGLMTVGIVSPPWVFLPLWMDSPRGVREDAADKLPCLPTPPCPDPVVGKEPPGERFNFLSIVEHIEEMESKDMRSRRKHT
jgi:hypothetical protein